MREVVRTLKAPVGEGCRPLAEGGAVVPVVQWALHIAYRERYEAYPYQFIFGCEPTTLLTTSAGGWDDESTVERLAPERVRTLVGELVQSQEKLHQDIL